MTRLAPPPAMRLLTIKDLCQILGVSRATIYRWRSEGKPLPPAIGIGAHPRWRQSDVDQFLEQQLGTGDL